MNQDTVRQSMEFAVTPRDVFILVLRLMGCWFLVPGVSSFVVLLCALTWVSPNFASQGIPLDNSPVVAAAIAYSSLAIAFLFFAPSIASWFYAEESTDQTQAKASRFTPLDLSRILLRLLGFYALLFAVRPIGVVAKELLASRFGGAAWENADWWLSVVQVAMYLLFSGFLVFKTDRIITLFSISDSFDSAANNE